MDDWKTKFQKEITPMIKKYYTRDVHKFLNRVANFIIPNLFWIVFALFAGLYLWEFQRKQNTKNT